MSDGKQFYCAYCGNVKLTKDEIGLNKKIIHSQIERMMCLTCMAAYLETTEEEMRDRIKLFKYQGCTLFG